MPNGEKGGYFSTAALSKAAASTAVLAALTWFG